MSSPVVLNIYDLSEYNSWMYWCGAGGIFHTGVEVYSEEYAFGGHDYDMSGIFVTSPRDAPGPVLYRESIIVGETQLSREEVHKIVQQMGREFKGNQYHLLQRNCNHFADDLVFKLCGSHAPTWVNRLAGLAVCLHCLLPAAWVPPLSVPTAAPVECPAGEPRPGEERETLLRRTAQQPYQQSAEVGG